MESVIERVGGTAIVRLSGSLAEGPAHRQGALWDLVEELARSASRVVLNLCALGTVDAMGIGEIAEAYRRARSRGVRLVLVGPSSRVDRLLSITRLKTIVEVYGTEAEALERGGGREPAGLLAVHGLTAA
jgi:anti-anti-sigma factor